jgi:hypothetical protein
MRKRDYGWFCELGHDWDSFLPGCNWRNFTFIAFTVEVSGLKNSAEVHVALLGFSLTLTYQGPSEFLSSIVGASEQLRADLERHNLLTRDMVATTGTATTAPPQEG